MADRGIVHAGLLESVTRPLAEARIGVAAFDAVEPNPTDETVLQGSQFPNNEQPQAVIGLRGGSPVVSAFSRLSIRQTTD
jgi:alcohol dehydrogenase class IV